jgi:type IV pilus assembly protein PilB
MLVARGLLTSARLTQVLSHQLSLPWVSLAKVAPEPKLLARVPKEVAKRLGIVPVYLRLDGARSTLYVATDDPTNEPALQECAKVARIDVRPMVAAPEDVRAAIDVWYGGGAERPGGSFDVEPVTGSMRMLSQAPSAAPREPPPKPPARPPSAAPIELDDADLLSPPAPPVAEAAAPSELPRGEESPKVPEVVLAVSAPASFVRACRIAAEALGAKVEKADLVTAAARARALSPFAIVVTDDVYAFDRPGLVKLALEVRALLVIWSDDLEAEYLEPLLVSAHERRRGG